MAVIHYFCACKNYEEDDPGAVVCWKCEQPIVTVDVDDTNGVLTANLLTLLVAYRKRLESLADEWAETTPRGTIGHSISLVTSLMHDGAKATCVCGWEGAQHDTMRGAAAESAVHLDYEAKQTSGGPTVKRPPCHHDSTRVDDALDSRCLACGADGYWHDGHRHDVAHPSGKVLIRLGCEAS